MAWRGGGGSFIPERNLDGMVSVSPGPAPAPSAHASPPVSPPPPASACTRRQGGPHPASPGSRYPGGSRRTDASRMMTSCGQQSLNVLAVLSLLISAGRTSVGGRRGGGRGRRRSLPGVRAGRGRGPGAGREAPLGPRRPPLVRAAKDGCPAGGASCVLRPTCPPREPG